MLSIIIPTITGDIDATIQSILAEKLDCEIIISYDPEKRGAPYARNKGWKEASGDYIFFCDDDVILIPGAIERLQSTLRGLDFPVGYAYGDFRYKNHLLWADDVFRSKPFDPEELRSHNYISTMSLIKRRAMEIVGEWPDVPHFQDWHLWNKMLDKGIIGTYVPGDLFSTVYSRHGITNSLANSRLDGDEG